MRGERLSLAHVSWLFPWHLKPSHARLCPSVHPRSAFTNLFLVVNGHSGPQPGAALCTRVAVNDSMVGSCWATSLHSHVTGKPIKESCHLLILREMQGDRVSLWPAGRWWLRGDGRHSRSPLVPKGDCPGGGRGNEDYEAATSLGFSRSGGMKSTVLFVSTKPWRDHPAGPHVSVSIPGMPECPRNL